MADVQDEAATYEVVLENVSDPLGVFLVSFLFANGLDVFRVRDCQGAGWLQDIPNRNPVFPGRFHADVLAIVPCEPFCQFSQFVCESGEFLALIGGHTIFVRSRNTGENKRFVDIQSTADRVNDSEHCCPPEKYLANQAGTGGSAKKRVMFLQR